MAKPDRKLPSPVLRKAKHRCADETPPAIVLIDREGLVCGIFAGPAEVRAYLQAPRP